MSKKILIVEDDELSMKLHTNILKKNDYEIIQSFDGEDTIQIAKEQQPDLIIMDIRLPQVSGLEHIKALKADELLKNIPVLTVTAFEKLGDEMKIILAGTDDYLPKPISGPIFLETVEKLLK